jgi:hypothetical protein
MMNGVSLRGRYQDKLFRSEYAQRFTALGRADRGRNGRVLVSNGGPDLHRIGIIHKHEVVVDAD